MSHVRNIAKFFNLSPKRQQCLEEHVQQYCDSLKSKLLPLCQTRWVERINALEVAIDLLEAVVNAFTSIIENSGEWNRETVNLASSLLKYIDFEFVINLFVVQRLLSFTSGLTTGLQKQGIDIANCCEQVQLLIRTLKRVRDKVNEFNHDCFVEAFKLCEKLKIEIKMPRICQRQIHRLNAMPSSGQQVEDYYQINLTIPCIDEITQQMVDRFSETQLSVLKGMFLLPSSVITELNWITMIQPFLQFYAEDIPSPRLIAAELEMWQTLWGDRWSAHWKCLQQQHSALGRAMNVSELELKVLKRNAVPNTVAATLPQISKDIFPNIYHLLCILGVLPITTCEAERSVSALCRLKTYTRSTMGTEMLTGLALMNTHRHINIDIDQVITLFATKHPRRMKFVNILEDK